MCHAGLYISPPLVPLTACAVCRQGELYFELHRGTYTSHAANKAFNRRCELLLRDVEMAASIALTVGGGGGGEAYVYPREPVEAIWQDVLLFQFHDVLPGSAIGMVYDVALARYAVIVPQLIALREAALAAAVGGGQQPSYAPVPGAEASALPLSCSDILGALPLPLPPSGGGNSSGHLSGAPLAPQPPPCLFNSLGFARTEVVAVPSDRVPLGAPVLQWTPGGAEALFEVTTPPLSLTPLFGPQGRGADGWAGHPHHGASAEAMPYSSFLAATSGATGGRGSAAVRGDEIVYVLSNRFLRAAFDCSGRMLALYDRTWLRELVPPEGLGNRFRMFEDIPTFWDAWDIEATHLEKSWDAGNPGQMQGGEGGAAGPPGSTPPLSGPIPGASVRIIESGPLRVSLRIEFALSGRSRLVQVISMTAAAPRQVVSYDAALLILSLLPVVCHSVAHKPDQISLLMAAPQQG